MPLNHLSTLEISDSKIIMEEWDNLSYPEIYEIKAFVNSKIIEYYFNKINEKRIIDVINGNILIMKKRIDWSIFNYGWTIPQDKHYLINLISGDLSRGTSKEIKFSINDQIFYLKLSSFDRKTTSDTLQIRYDSNGNFMDYIKDIFSESWDKLSKTNKHKSDKIIEYFLMAYNKDDDIYKIIPKKGGNKLSYKQNYWWVNQGKTNNKKQFLWAPIKDKNGRTKFYWENVSKVKPGDLIIHYSDGNITGFSIAETNSYKAECPYETERWKDEGFKVNINFYSFEKQIDINDIAEELYREGKKYSPISSNYSVNQGYLYKLDDNNLQEIIKNTRLKNDYNKINKHIKKPDIGKVKEVNKKFKYKNLSKEIMNSGLYFSDDMICRFVSSICTKNFLILTGLSGSGKTKLAQAFVKWIVKNHNQYSMVTVGSDWTNREPLIGYVNAIESNKYVKPNNNVIDVLIDAFENSETPYFLILDEMNLSHVERYFADFLSAMESNEPIQLHEGGFENKWESDSGGVNVPGEIKLPDNLYIIGTVNIDETTYMFSPKVLDRANVIEFRVEKNEIENFLKNPGKPNLKNLESKGSNTASDFVKQTRENKKYSKSKELKNILLDFFDKLKDVGAEFGYRTASEIMDLAANIEDFTENEGGVWPPEKIADTAIMQKLLPKLHGSRKKLGPVLESLAELCIENSDAVDLKKLLSGENEIKELDKFVKYPESLEKIIRMYRRLIQNGFTSFTEA